MGFWWSLEPARTEWAGFMLELRQTYEQDKQNVQIRNQGPISL